MLGRQQPPSSNDTSLETNTTLVAAESTVDVLDATKELIQLLLHHEELNDSLSTSVHRLSNQDSQRYWLRLLQLFAHDLREEAKDSVEHHAGVLVERWARSISQAPIPEADHSSDYRAAQITNPLHKVIREEKNYSNITCSRLQKDA